VIGDEHSDVPVVLPTEAIALDGFRRAHAGDTFWCGVLLGGCGAQLAHKLYIDRQCHFQHYPQADGTPHTCRRPRVGESSADHLYVKSAMSQSLLEHGRAGLFAFPPPIGSLLEVEVQDGGRLRVHMDNMVPPDWADDPTVVLGAGVELDPGILTNCPYVYRVRCESDGASRRVWIGTQSLARPTEWIPLSDCAWSEDGLLTPAATRILDEQPAPAPAHGTAESGHRPGAVPENVLLFIRGLEAAQRSGTVEHVRRLCGGSGAFLDTLQGPDRAEAKGALDEARTWLASHEDYQQRVFTDLRQAVAERRAFDVRSQLVTAVALTRRGSSVMEQRVLAEARAFLRQQNHLPGPGRTVLHPLPGSSRPPRRAPQPPNRHEKPKTPKEPTERTTSREPNSTRAERRSRRTAVRRARTIMERLAEGHRVPADEKQKLTEELAGVVETAGDWLSADEQKRAKSWIRKSSARRKPESGRQERHELTADVVQSTAAAVRGALKRAAREQNTISWAQLRRQLGAALPDMTMADRVRILTLVDQSTPADQPLLSCLVAAGDPEMMTAFREVAGALGLEPPADEDDLRDVVEADVQQVHRHWRWKWTPSHGTAPAAKAEHSP
jgi:hypothetical protein